MPSFPATMTSFSPFRPTIALVLAIAPVVHAAVKLSDEASLYATASTPEGRHLLAVDELNRVAGAEVKKLDSSFDGRKFIQDLLASQDRLTDFMYSGPMDNPAKSLRILSEIWKSDPEGIKDRREQTTAAAVAITFGQDKWPEDGALERYRYFRDSRREGKLHKSFDSLEAWEKRYVVSAGSNGGWSGSGGAWGDDSLVWLRDNVKLPVKDYTGACWQAPYKLNNLFGDSIHGSKYYAPFDHMIHAERVREIGGVCGSLSHYGATAARANGIPAITMGEPGHCAYAVRVARGEWTPAYSLSWQRGLHTSLWGKTWTQLVQQEKAFDDKNAFQRCYAHLWQARALKATNPALAETAYAAALEAQPINYVAWTESLEFIRDVRKPTAESWEIIGKSIVAGLGEFPETAWDVTSRIQDAALAALPEARREGFLLRFHEGIAKQDGPVMWDYGKALDSQVKALNLDRTKELGFFEKVLTIQSTSKSWFAPTIAWGQERYNTDFGASSAYFAVLGRVFSTAGGSGSNEEGLKAALGPAILAAEKADNVSAFQSLGRAASAFTKPAGQSVDPFPGDLLSSGGLLRISSTSNWDHPINHWGVIEAQGGSFHTDKEVRPNAVVRLGKLGDLSGIVVLGTDYGQNGSRQMPLKVSVSEDGSTWTEVFRTTDPKGPWRIPLQGKATRVQFVKVERDDDRKEVFHLAGIRAYGRRLQ